MKSADIQTIDVSELHTAEPLALALPREPQPYDFGSNDPTRDTTSGLRRSGAGVNSNESFKSPREEAIFEVINLLPNT